MRLAEVTSKVDGREKFPNITDEEIRRRIGRSQTDPISSGSTLYLLTNEQYESEIKPQLKMLDFLQEFQDKEYNKYLEGIKQKEYNEKTT